MARLIPRSRAAWTRLPPHCRIASCSFSASISSEGFRRPGEPRQGAIPADPRGIHKGKSSGLRTESSERMTACSMAYRSSRTLPGKIVTDEAFERRRREDTLLAVAADRLDEKVASERLDVVRPFAQGGNDEGDHRKPVEEIFSKLARRDRRLKVAIGRGEDADIHALRPVLADPPYDTVFDDSQQLRLRRNRSRAHFVEEEGSAARLFEESPLEFRRSGERPASVSKQFALEEIFGQRCTVQGQVGRIRARSARLDEPRDDILARPGLSEDEDSGGRARHLLRARQEFAHDAALADGRSQAMPPPDFARQGAHFFPQAPRFERKLDTVKQLFGLHRLGEIVEGSHLHCLDRVLDRAKARDQQHLRRIGFRAACLEDVEPRGAGHLKIGQHNIERAAFARS